MFNRLRVAVFVDGDFWHGWRFGTWRGKLTTAWETKIEQNRARDRRNHLRLRRTGWTLVRIWEHQLERDVTAAAERVATLCPRLGRLDFDAWVSRPLLDRSVRSPSSKSFYFPQGPTGPRRRRHRSVEARVVIMIKVQSRFLQVVLSPPGGDRITVGLVH